MDGCWDACLMDGCWDACLMLINVTVLHFLVDNQKRAELDFTRPEIS